MTLTLNRSYLHEGISVARPCTDTEHVSKVPDQTVPYSYQRHLQYTKLVINYY
jgi:hypothetical protein